MSFALNLFSQLFSSVKMSNNTSLKRSNDDTELYSNKKIAFYNITKVQAFMKLLDNPVIQNFLKVDVCNVLADKYLIAMVFVYFVRAQLPVEEYNTLNFFSALYLAQDMEEEICRLNYWLIHWCPGNGYFEKQANLNKGKLNIWKLMDFRCLVSKTCCDQIMISIHHSVWNRERDEVHSGAIRRYSDECKFCKANETGLNYHTILNAEFDEYVTASSVDTSSGNYSAESLTVDVSPANIYEYSS